MDTLSYKTVSANKTTVNKEWVVIDAEGQILGRLASEVAKILRGKNKPSFTPHVDGGDNVIVINAEKVVLSGKKLDTRRRKLGVIMGDNVQTGINSMINVGTMISNNSFIGPGAVVTGEITSNTKIL